MKRLLILFLFSCTSNSFQVIRGKTMGTTYVIKVENQQKSTVLAKEIEDIFFKINQQMSTYLVNSEISRFNKHQSTDPFKVSSDFLFVLKQSKEIHKITLGAFDPSVMPLVNLWGFGPQRSQKTPSEDEIKKTLNYIGLDKLRLGRGKIQKSHPFLELDLSAIAKGYAIDKVVGYLDSHSKNFLIELGGEVFARGMKDEKNSKYWQIGIEKPLKNKRQTKEVLRLKDECVATSGDYRNFKKGIVKKYSHLIDLKTGKPKDNDYVSVSVVAPTCLYADALATAMLVSGRDYEIEKTKSKVLKRSDL